jgi:hypothetical protein
MVKSLALPPDVREDFEAIFPFGRPPTSVHHANATQQRFEDEKERLRNKLSDDRRKVIVIPAAATVRKKTVKDAICCWG